jgi:hypothetical protein
VGDKALAFLDQKQSVCEQALTTEDREESKKQSATKMHKRRKMESSELAGRRWPFVLLVPSCG